MPILERDPWRTQYFEDVPCPDDLEIPTDDPDCWRLYPEHRWLYNKLEVAATQGLDSGPHGIAPPTFPVFSKPIYNLRGMGVGSRVIRSAQEYERLYAPGHMWMHLLEGEHVSTDAAVLEGEPLWWRHVTGVPLAGGMFDRWIVEAEPRPGLESAIGTWIRRHLRGYSGLVNFETIGGVIIEAHLRFSDQWPDLYGRGWVESVVELYRSRRWTFADAERCTGHSVVLFGAHGLRYRRPDSALLEEQLARPEVTSIQITFHEDKPPEAHAMPPGGFRLAIVNCLDLEVGLQVRERLALMFWSTQELAPRRSRRPRGRDPRPRRD